MRKSVIIEVRANEYKYRDHNERHWNRHVPYTADEIGDDALQCEQAGASIYHFHAREADGDTSVEPLDYANAVRACRQRGTNLVMMPTNVPKTANIKDKRKQVRSVADRIYPIALTAQSPSTRCDLGPVDLVTCNLSHLDDRDERKKVYENTVADWLEFADGYKKAGLKTVAFLWNVGSVGALEELIEHGHIKPPIWCEVILSRKGAWYGHPATPRGLDAFLDFFPATSGWNWTVLSSGESLLPLVDDVLDRGGNISIGLGDYHYQHEGKDRTNAEIVARVVEKAQKRGVEPAKPSEVRELLGLSAYDPTTAPA
jgi:uncharacterized protein (DUF849 family)